MSIELWSIAAAGLLLAETWRSHRQLRLAIGRRKKAPAPLRYPSVTVVRPIRGLDAGAEGNVRAGLSFSYPGRLETIFVFDRADDPAVPVVRRVVRELQSERPIWVRVLFSGSPPVHRTGKLNAMMVGLDAAQGELVAFADSDTRPEPGTLTTLVDTLLASEDAGAAFAPVVVTEPARTLGDVGYALMLNGLYGPAAALTSERAGGSLPFIMGQMMVFKRGALAAIGGLQSAEGQLVDDMYLGRRLSEVGYRNMVAPVTLPIIQQGLSLGEFIRIFVRWLAFSRSGLPAWSFKASSWMRGAVFFLGLGLSVLALALGHFVAAALAALVPVAVAASINDLHRELGGVRIAPRHWWASFALVLASPLIMLRVLLRRDLDWRGRRYTLDPRSQLAPTVAISGEYPGGA